MGGCGCRYDGCQCRLGRGKRKKKSDGVEGWEEEKNERNEDPETRVPLELSNHNIAAVLRSILVQPNYTKLYTLLYVRTVRPLIGQPAQRTCNPSLNQPNQSSSNPALFQHVRHVLSLLCFSNNGRVIFNSLASFYYVCAHSYNTHGPGHIRQTIQRTAEHGKKQSIHFAFLQASSWKGEEKSKIEKCKSCIYLGYVENGNICQCFVHEKCKKKRNNNKS